MKRLRIISLLVPFLILSCGKQEAPPDSAVLPAGEHAASAPAGKRLKIGYVLHGLNDFTQVIKRGAEDAGKAMGVDVEVIGPAGFSHTEAIAMFEGMVQKGVDGIAVIPMPGDVWVKPIKEAKDEKVPVVTANITSEGAGVDSWFGQDEYQSGVILADELKKALGAGGKKSGKIVSGICAPGVAVLVDRFKGFKKALEGTAYTATDPTDVTTENTSNYAAWENLASANPDAVAIIGLCSMDIPNLAKLKDKSKGKWMIGGYDLGKEQLDSLKSGTTQVVLGQHPYLQGYLPVVALVEHIRNKKPLPRGWVNVGTEVVTKANAEAVTPRETDHAAETKWYADHVEKNFKDLNGVAKPMPANH